MSWGNRQSSLKGLIFEVFQYLIQILVNSDFTALTHSWIVEMQNCFIVILKFGNTFKRFLRYTSCKTLFCYTTNIMDNIVPCRVLTLRIKYNFEKLVYEYFTCLFLILFWINYVLCSEIFKKKNKTINL